MSQHLDSLLPPLLQHLQAEEQLLHEARAVLTEVHAALRRGDLRAVREAHKGQESMALALQDAEAARIASIAELAQSIGLPSEGLTLAILANHLPDFWASEVKAARDRLAAVVADTAEIRLRNANLIHHLRSFFRGVLSSLTFTDAPVRYGPSGSQLAPVLGGAIQTRG